MTAYPLTVYYDASCALCRAEMQALKARDADDRLLLVDCAAEAFVVPRGVSREALMSRIHARDANGRWLVGVDVFAEVYEAAGQVLVARLYRSRALRPLFDRIYPWVADHRQALSRLGLARVFGPSGERACPVCTSERPKV